MYLSPGTHGVIIVHGIGDQLPGDTLAGFAKGICDALINSPKGNDLPAIELKSDLSGSPPSVTLRITSPYGEQANWVCQEAYWNDAFPPPSATQVLWWGVNQNLRNQLSSLLKTLEDPVNEELPTETERQKEKAKAGSGAGTTGAVEQSKKSKTQVRAKSGILSGIALIPLVPLTYFLLGLTWLLHIVPSIGPLDKAISWIRKLDPSLSSSLGDVQRYVEQQIWSANARARLENIVIAMLNDGGIKDITIVAHSMGSIVAYDALTEGGNIADAITRAAGKNSKKITFVSVGAAINRVFAVVSPPSSKKSAREKARDTRYNDLQITKPLAKAITGYGDAAYAGHLEDKFFWLDIFARRDPVPSGPIETRIIEKAGIDPIKQMKERKVINTDNFVFDHSSYWGNKELVMPRIVRAINGGKGYPWPEAGITEDKVSRRVRIALRVVSLTEIALFLAMLAVIIFVWLKLAGIA
ncbi:MAG: alpha/beta hydrolase [Chloroflexi bacterium]|nr:alpha/beta hydrolase [Chloroflexota bacterium]